MDTKVDLNSVEIGQKKTIEYQDRIVAFIDILGFTDSVYRAVKDSDEWQKIQTVILFLKAWDSATGKNNWDTSVIEKLLGGKPKNLPDWSIEGDLSCLCVSDSIIASYPYKEDTIHETFSTFIANLAQIASTTMEAGFLLRGGISIGSLAHTNTKDGMVDSMVIGPAYQDAVSLEKDYAVLSLLKWNRRRFRT